MKKTILLTALGICCMVAATSRTKAAEKVSGKYHYEIINSTQKTAALTKVEQPGTQVILPSSIDGYTIVQLGTMKENNYHFASASTLRLEGKAELFSAADAEKVTELTIPSKVEKIGVMSFQGCKKIKKVTLPKALTHIGSNAFNGCESLQNITIPKKVKGIGSGAFMKCAALKKVTLKMSKATIGSEAFSTDVTDGYDANGNPKIIKKSHLTKIVMPYKYKGLLKKELSVVMLELLLHGVILIPITRAFCVDAKT
ncbi:MAG: leucine-rich repeat domain-containing protein [Clostridium sp.]